MLYQEKKYVDDRDNTKLSLTGGTMTGDITIGNNKIITTSDPTLDTHLARKKYVDDQDAKKLSLTGGVMTGDIVINDYRIWSTSDPTHDRHLTRKIYVDEKDLTRKKYVDNKILPNILSNLYTLQMDDEGIFNARDDVEYVEYNGSNKKIGIVFNFSRKKDWNLIQSIPQHQPYFKKSTINNNFYCIEYPGSDSYNLNLYTLQDILSSRYLNFYFIFGLKSMNTSSSNEVSLFKITNDELGSGKLQDDFGISYIS